MKKRFLGKAVLIRTQSSGVHFGILIEREGTEVLLSNARRIWNWTGALSLSEISQRGINLSGSKVSVKVEEIILTQATEIILISKESNLPCD